MPFTSLCNEDFNNDSFIVYIQNEKNKYVKSSDALKFFVQVAKQSFPE